MRKAQLHEVEVVDRFDSREVRGADPHHAAFVLAIGDLSLQQRGKKFRVRPVLLPGLLGQLLPERPDDRGLEHPGQVGDLRGQTVLDRRCGLC